MPRPAKGGETKYVVPAVQKAFRILELFASEKRVYSISEVSRVLKIPVSSASALLYTMMRCGYLSRSENGGFSLTMKLLAEANKALNQIELLEIARPELEALTQTTGLASVLCVRDGDRIVCIDKVEGASQIRLVTQIGSRLYFHHSATGKAFLAQLSEPEVEKILHSAGLPSFTHNTITSRSALQKELTRIRAQGYSLDDQEAGLGIRAIGAAIFDRSAAVIASIAVGGAVFELDGNIQRVAREVTRAALGISQKLGFGTDN